MEQTNGSSADESAMSGDSDGIERRRNMDREISGLKELIALRFDGTDERLEQLTAQVRLTNGRVKQAEQDIAVLKDRLYLASGAAIVSAVAYAVSLFRQ